MFDWDNSQKRCAATIWTGVTQTTSVKLDYFNRIETHKIVTLERYNNTWLLKSCDVQSRFFCLFFLKVVWEHHQTLWSEIFNFQHLNCSLFIDDTSTNSNLIHANFERQPWASSLRRSLTSLGVGPSGTSGFPTFGGRPFLRRLPFALSPTNCRSELGGRPLRPSIAKIRGMTSSSFSKLHCKPYREIFFF